MLIPCKIGTLKTLFKIFALNLIFILRYFKKNLIKKKKKNGEFKFFF